MSRQAAPQNTFGFCEDCPPTSDLGLAIYHLDILFFLVVVISLITGLKLSARERLLPLLTMVAIGALIFQLSQSIIHFEKQYYVLYTNSDRSFSSSHERTAHYRNQFSKIEERNLRIFSKGWAAYSLFPFSVGLAFGITKRRRKARLERFDQRIKVKQPGGSD